jgi:hypothetical protein
VSFRIASTCSSVSRCAAGGVAAGFDFVGLMTLPPMPSG